MSNRETFEEWYSGTYRETIHILPNGQYASLRQQHSWDAWQARVPDGYKLVLVNEYYELVRSNRYKHEQNIELSKEVKVLRDRKKYYKSKYKAMIESEQ